LRAPKLVLVADIAVEPAASLPEPRAPLPVGDPGEDRGVDLAVSHALAMG
jgi:hypothetical protein